MDWVASHDSLVGRSTHFPWIRYFLVDRATCIVLYQRKRIFDWPRRYSCDVREQTFNMAYLPMGDTNSYDRFGQIYNISRILNPDVTLNITAYNEYSDLYMSPPYISYYLLAFTLSTCVITHTLLYHGRTIWDTLRNINPEEEDIHAKLMKVYKEVPGWWYWGIITVFFFMACVSVQVRYLASPWS